jgi:hypothetical protein
MEFASKTGKMLSFQKIGFAVLWFLKTQVLTSNTVKQWVIKSEIMLFPYITSKFN